MSVDLQHHGDRDTAPGLIDLAVNVRLPSPPAWLAEVITSTVADLGRYPDAGPAAQAIAHRHGVPEEAVLPTSGGAEGFTLVARAVTGVEPWVVHPQFTEPEAALAAAGRPVRRHVLAAGAGFRLDPAALALGGSAEGCDLVVVGNPTNPTGVLHRRADLLALRRPGRVVVVDEAFMDAVPGETESLIGDDLEGLLVLRSLTKTWGLAGLRAGYVVGDPALVSALRAVQPPWSVSSPALAATVACLSDRGIAESSAAALEIATLREVLLDELTAVGVAPVSSRAPFVLVQTSAFGPGSVRESLAQGGFAVRRGETFPGLGPTWIRIAVRDADTSRQLCAALGRLGGRRVG